MAAEPVTVVVRRRVKAGAEADFESAMQGFVHFALAFPGNRGIDVLRPGRDGPPEYTVVDHFADAAARQAFKDTPSYADWMRRLREFSDHDPFMEEMGGVGGWFTLPATPHAAPPSTLKMALVTFVGVYPLTSILPPLGSWLFPTWHPLVLNVLVTGLIVACLSWAVMPVLTKLFGRWLFAPVKPLFYVGAIAATFMFWSSGFAKAAHFHDTLGEMAHFGLQPAWLFAAGTVALQLAGSALVVFGGRYAWLGAGVLGLFTLATIPLAHAFWNLPPEAAFAERLIAEEHVSVVGGLLVAALLARQYGPQWRRHGATR